MRLTRRTFVLISSSLFCLQVRANSTTVDDGPSFGLTADWNHPNSISLNGSAMFERLRRSEWHWCRNHCTISTWTLDGKWYDVYMTQDYEETPEMTKENDIPPFTRHWVEIAPPLLRSMDEMARMVPDEGPVIPDVIKNGWGKNFDPVEYAKKVRNERRRRRRLRK